MAQSGIDALNKRRERRTRQAPKPRHPATPTALTVGGVAPETVQDNSDRPEPVVDKPTSQPAAPAAQSEGTTPPKEAETQEAASTAAQQSTSGVPEAVQDNPDRPEPVVDEAAPQPAAPAQSTETTPATASTPAGAADPSGDLPPLEIDLRDPEAQIVSPTQMSIPESIVARFEKARPNAPSHTAIVLNALRQHAHELPALILARRPGPTPGDLFPWRGSPGDSGSETPLPLRIRPTKAELKVMKALQDWSTERIRAERPGARETYRSEMVAAALDAYLPGEMPRRNRK